MRRNLAEPPDVPPERLWRSLLPRRPERRLRFRFDVAPSLPLFVRPVPSAAEAAARDELASVPDVLRDELEVRSLVALVLHTPAGLAFADAEALGALEAHELAELDAEVATALADIAPTLARSNMDAWGRALREGAEHLSNASAAAALASCVDVTAYASGREWHVQTRPRLDRYWGLPTAEILDGHWMAFQAARQAMKDRK
ncbi:MAG TPA: hypothetical protein VF765_24455 [Polyangiaceae bacterium]